MQFIAHFRQLKFECCACGLLFILDLGGTNEEGIVAECLLHGNQSKELEKILQKK